MSQPTLLKTVYRTKFYNLFVYKNKSRPMAIFSNGEDAVAVFIDRHEAADMLKRNFRKKIDKSISRA